MYLIELFGTINLLSRVTWECHLSTQLKVQNCLLKKSTLQLIKLVHHTFSFLCIFFLFFFGGGGGGGGSGEGSSGLLANSVTVTPNIQRNKYECKVHCFHESSNVILLLEALCKNI